MVAALSAQPTYQNIKFRKFTNVSSTKQTYAPTFERGYRYDVVTTDVNHPSFNSSREQLFNGSNSRYYHSYGVRKVEGMNVVYNTSYRIDRSVTYNVANRAPFEDVVVTSSQRRVSEEDLPNDPSVPLGDGVIPLLLFSIALVIYRYKKN